MLSRSPTLQRGNLKVPSGGHDMPGPPPTPRRRPASSPPFSPPSHSAPVQPRFDGGGCGSLPSQRQPEWRARRCRPRDGTGPGAADAAAAGAGAPCVRNKVCTRFALDVQGAGPVCTKGQYGLLKVKKYSSRFARKDALKKKWFAQYLSL